MASKIRSVFAALNRGDCDPMIESLAPDFVYTFHGTNALAGTRRTREALELWWQRIFRLFPGAQFAVKDIVVGGWPWHTTVATRMAIAVDRAEGGRYENVFFQFIKISWGRVRSVETLEDTSRLDEQLRDLVDRGVAEAGAPMITDA